jgi:hypothetical protein
MDDGILRVLVNKNNLNKKTVAETGDRDDCFVIEWPITFLSLLFNLNDLASVSDKLLQEFPNTLGRQSRKRWLSINSPRLLFVPFAASANVETDRAADQIQFFGVVWLTHGVYSAT